MRQKQTDGYAERLDRARSEGPNPMSVRGLHRAVEERFPDLRGTSYGGIRQYAEGNVRNPRIELLRALADVLGVRADWLAFGEGPMTEREAARMRAQRDGRAEAVSEDVLDIRRAFASMEEAVGDLPTAFLGRDEVLVGLAFDLTDAEGSTTAERQATEYGEAVELLAWLMMLPAELLGGVDHRNGRQYFMAMAAALSAAIPGPGESPGGGLLANLRAARGKMEGSQEREDS